MNKVKHYALCVFISLAIMVPLSAHGEEGGSGHYTPGGNASFIDALPGKPGWAIANFFTFYDADASADKQLPFGGMVTADLDATIWADTVIALYQTPGTLMGGSYVVGVAVPYIWMDIDGNVRFNGPEGKTITRDRRDSTSGIGDITVYPFMLGWTDLGGDLKYDVRLGIYMPTGDYVKNDLANAGKNYWTFEPAVTVNYLSSTIGLEMDAFAGVDFNTKNNATDYLTGNQFHIDVTVAEHLPFLGGIIGAGATGFYYDQLNGDGGDGAMMGDCKGRTSGVGPVLSYVIKLGQKDLITEVKWLPEIDVNNRLEGDYIWFKFAMLL